MNNQLNSNTPNHNNQNYNSGGYPQSNNGSYPNNIPPNSPPGTGYVNNSQPLYNQPVYPNNNYNQQFQQPIQQGNPAQYTNQYVPQQQNVYYGAPPVQQMPPQGYQQYPQQQQYAPQQNYQQPVQHAYAPQQNYQQPVQQVYAPQQPPAQGYVSPVYPYQQNVIQDPFAMEKHIEREHLKKTANGHGLALLFQQGIGIVVSVVVIFFLVSNILSDPYIMSMLRSGDWSGYMKAVTNNSNMMQSMIYILFATGILGSIIPSFAFFKRRNLKLKDIFINPSTRNNEILKPKSIVTLSIFALGINGLAQLLSILLSYLKVESPSSIDNMFDTSSPVSMVLLLLSTCIVAPIFEEILFRGVILQPLRRYGDKFAIIISAIIFGLAHGNLSQAPFAFTLGLLLGYVTTKSNSIFTSIIIHFVNNTIASLTVFLPDQYYYIIYLVMFTCSIYAVYKIATRKKWVSFENEQAIPVQYMPHKKYHAYFGSPAVIIIMVFYIASILISIFSVS